MIVLFYDKQQLAYIYKRDKAVAKRVDLGATLFGASKNDTEIKLHGDGLGSVYDLVKVIAETSGRRLAFVEG